MSAIDHPPSHGPAHIHAEEHAHEEPPDPVRPEALEGPALESALREPQGERAGQNGGRDSGPHRRLPSAATLHVLKPLLFLAFAAYFGWMVLSGNLGNYVGARSTWLAVLAALLFLMLGLGSLRRPAHVHLHLDHVHPTASWLVIGIVAVPLALGVLVPSQPLGAAAVTGDMIPTLANDQRASAAGSSATWTVVDWLRLFYYGGAPDRLNGREADVVGFVYRKPDDPAGSFTAARFLMSCCSADAYAIGLPVVWDGADAEPVDTWVRIHGTIRVEEYKGNALPVLHATTVDDTIPKPRDPYVY